MTKGPKIQKNRKRNNYLPNITFIIEANVIYCVTIDHVSFIELLAKINLYYNNNTFTTNSTKISPTKKLRKKHLLNNFSLDS